MTTATAARKATTTPGLDRKTAMSLAIEELRRYADLLESLDDSGWSALTVCEPWSVRDMAGHVLGNHESLVSLRARVRGLVQARRHGGNLVDALSATQIDARSALTPAEVVARLREVAPASVAARRKLPRVVRAVRWTVPMHAGTERWSGAYLDDTIYTRDAWMHRMDTCQAIGVEPELTADHDAVIVADIVREWQLRHGQDVQLTLTGTAGGTFGTGDGEKLHLDAVEFCRLLSGRGHGAGLLAVEVGY
jgi:uncharacterized protein (TIGR03083 family)